MKFNYIARRPTGQSQTGVIEAKNREEAISALQKAGLIIIGLQEKEEVSIFAREIKFFQRITTRDIVDFSRQFAVLFSAKISLVEALRTIGKQTRKTSLKDIILKMADDVEAGTVLSAALEKYPKIFSPFYINMVKSGEVAGNLEGVLNYLADYLEKQYYLISRIKGAMIYPAFVLCGFIVVAILMFVTIIPQLTSILEETGQMLPLTTRMIIFISDTLINWWWLILLLLLGGAGSFYYYLQNFPEAQRFLDNLKLKLPVFGQIFQKFYLARLSDSLGTLIKGGISIMQALTVSADIVGNKVIREIILEAREEVRIGNTISSVFEKHKEIPFTVSQMLAVGEQTGSMDEVLKKIADFYSKEVDSTVSTLSQLIEPILIVILGIGVGILVSAILMPIYNLAGGL